MLSPRKHLSKLKIQKSNPSFRILVGISSALLVFSIGMIFYILSFESTYKNKIYPGVTVDTITFSGTYPTQIEQYWDQKNKPFQNAQFEFMYENTIATVSGAQIDVGYDSNLAAMQAYLIGRSGNIFTDIMHRYFGHKTNITPFFRWKTDVLNETLNSFADSYNISPEDALFTFDNGKVTAFKPSKNGKNVNIEKTVAIFSRTLAAIPYSTTTIFRIPIIIDTVEPAQAMNSTNTFGIKEQIGYGYSEFTGSIPGRIHNVALAASRFNGVLIPPGETFSFNKTLGDVSASTGYQQAYIIKNGRTVLGDGGGVCQVSTTLFRAAMNAGLPIVERHAHAYRVHYYEEGGFKPGMDATVFDPSYDLKIKNNTPAYILIQTKTNLEDLSMEFTLYGTSDGRVSQISNEKVWAISPPPADLYQDDPTLKIGVIKQVDFAAWGAKASFDYKVMKGPELLENTTFYSDYRPWQAIYLKGTLQ